MLYIIPWGMLVGQKGTSRAGNTLPSDKRPQVPDAVQPKRKKAIKKTSSCNRAVGYPRPAYGQATIMGKRKWTKPHDFFIRSDTSFSAWHQQQCRPVFVLVWFFCFWFGYTFYTSKAANHHPSQDKLAHGVTSSTPAIVNYTNCSFQHTPLSLTLYKSP